MPVLDNAKHERFAQELATGATATDAHERAGYKRNDGNASTLANQPDIVARVKEIKGVAAEAAGVTAQRVIDELAKIGFANMLDYMQIGADGRPFHDFSALTREQAAAIQELIVETTPAVVKDDDEIRPEVQKVRLKLGDKRAALVDLGKHLGLFKDRVEHTGKDGGPIETADVSLLEAARRMAFVLAKAKRIADAQKPKQDK